MYTTIQALLQESEFAMVMARMTPEVRAWLEANAPRQLALFAQTGRPIFYRGRATSDDAPEAEIVQPHPTLTRSSQWADSGTIRNRLVDLAYPDAPPRAGSTLCTTDRNWANEFVSHRSRGAIFCIFPRDDEKVAVLSGQDFNYIKHNDDPVNRMHNIMWMYAYDALLEAMMLEVDEPSQELSAARDQAHDAWRAFIDAVANLVDVQQVDKLEHDALEALRAVRDAGATIPNNITTLDWAGPSTMIHLKRMIKHVNGGSVPPWSKLVIDYYKKIKLIDVMNAADVPQNTRRECWFRGPYVRIRA